MFSNSPFLFLSSFKTSIKSIFALQNKTMELILKKPICFFDLETTGINVATDRIVEIAILKVFPNGNKESHTWRVNPEMPIPEASSAIHGITDEMVANEPTFKELATKVYTLIKDSGLKLVIGNGELVIVGLTLPCNLIIIHS